MSSNASNFLVAEAQIVLDESRRQKAERTKILGSPIELPGKALGIEIRGNHAWIAENTCVVRKVDLESGETVQLYKGHQGPVSATAFCDKVSGSDDQTILVSGSWDKSIKLWDTKTKDLISTTPDAHSDFVKSLIVIPSLRMLVSSGSDKIVRFWDLTKLEHQKPLKSIGSISSHTRPVECLATGVSSANIASLYTADTMGIIKCWTIEREEGDFPRVKASPQHDYDYHRTKINDIHFGNTELWTASADETVQAFSQTGLLQVKPFVYISHPVAVRSILPLALSELAEPYLITGAGDVLRVYDLSSPDQPELIKEVDAHWHDVTAIRFWRRTIESDDTTTVEPWIVSTSLDGTIRKWKLTELLTPATPGHVLDSKENTDSASAGFQMTEEEERELAELMDE